MHISGTPRPIFVECMLPVAVATSYSGGFAIRYILSVYKSPKPQFAHDRFHAFLRSFRNSFFSISASDSTKNASKSKQIHYLANDLKPCNATETEVGKPASQDWK